MAREYKGYGIVRILGEWCIYSHGICVRKCRTLKEAKERIDNQTV